MGDSMSNSNKTIFPEEQQQTTSDYGANNTINDEKHNEDNRHYLIRFIEGDNDVFVKGYN